MKYKQYLSRFSEALQLQIVQPSRYCRDSTDLKACVPNPAYTLVGRTNVPRSACSSIHAARWQQLLNYNGRGDVSSARANAALGAIINVTRTYTPSASATRRKAKLFSLRSNRDQSC